MILSWTVIGYIFHMWRTLYANLIGRIAFFTGENIAHIEFYLQGLLPKILAIYTIWPRRDIFLFECLKLNIFQNSKKNFESPSGHVMFYIRNKHKGNNKPFKFHWERYDLVCNHSNSDIFACEDNLLFSQVKMFSLKSSPGTKLVFI